MPEIGLMDRSGQAVTLASLAGQVVIVDFWATWCEPCRQELPQLERLHKQYGGQGLRIVGVSVDKEPERLKAYLDKLPLSFSVVHDPQHQIKIGRASCRERVS
jgi:thiol-disulfide isomerase/thioredoxin